jgi:DNA repair protein RadA/Sms
LKQKTIYSCQQCGMQSHKWLEKCSDFGQWNSLVEETVTVAKKGGVLAVVSGIRLAVDF